jgi:myo-inositol-1(or 4)-monophosphatase
MKSGLALFAPDVVFIAASGFMNKKPQSCSEPRARSDLASALRAAVQAAHAAGQVMRRHFRSPKKINDTLAHDLKLELDERCQRLITRLLRKAFPEISILGEEGSSGPASAEYRWVVDPIDGTVNFAYQIPHACVSIALQRRLAATRAAAAAYETLVGVVYDPFCDETWTAIRGRAARLNGRVIQVSRRQTLAESVVSIGFAKHDVNLQKMLPGFYNLVPRVRKVRIMGSAALDLVYVASGRMDAYLEAGVRLWDIAAGGLILECAGGEFWNTPLPGDHFYLVMANNGKLRRKLLPLCGALIAKNQ